jgi:hypothetical protein
MHKFDFIIAVLPLILFSAKSTGLFFCSVHREGI